MTGLADHYHHCPTCYEAVPCDIGTCSIEPDLSDGERLFGHHWVCDDCEERAELRAALARARMQEEI